MVQALYADCVTDPAEWEPLTAIEQDQVQFRSKGKFYSFFREQRGVSSHSRAHALPNRLQLWVGLLYGDLVGGGGVLMGQAQLCCSHARSQRGCSVSARSPPPPFWICTRPWSWGVRSRHFAGGTAVWRASRVQGLCVPCGILPASETRGSTKKKRGKKKKRLEFILLPRFYSYFPGIGNGLCWWQMWITATPIFNSIGEK